MKIWIGLTNCDASFSIFQKHWFHQESAMKDKKIVAKLHDTGIPFYTVPQTPIHFSFGSLAMLKVCFQLLGSGRPADKEHTRKKEPGRSLLLERSFQSSRDISVRIVHAGGREELYETTLPAAELMDKYPGMCIARPQVFKNPHESLVPPEEELLTGHKYLMIPSSTAQKLKRKHRDRVKAEDLAKVEEEVAYAMITADVGEETSEGAFCSAKDFYSSKGSVRARSTARPSRRKNSRTRKPFVPPIRRGGIGWKPGLTSIQEQELSP